MTLLVVTFLSVFLLAFQQQNVAKEHYKSAIITSWLIALSQFFVYREAAAGEWWEWIYMGAGGSLGVVLAMKFHKRIFKRIE